MRCKYSNYTYDRTTIGCMIKTVEVERFTPKMKLRYLADGVVCPGCGRKIAVRKHPNSGNSYMIIPAHNFPEVKP